MPRSQTKIEQYHLHKAHPEKLQFEVYNLRDYRKKSAEKAAKPHSHSYYQIIWFFQEGGHHTIDFKSFNIQKNMVLFIAKDQVHSFDDNLEVNGWLIHFNESFFMHTDVDIFLKYNIFNSAQNPCYAIDKATVGMANDYIKLMVMELEHRHRFGYENVLRFLLKSLLIILERVHQQDGDRKPKLSSHYELKFFRFKELLEANYSRGLSVKAYAEMLHISSKTLTTVTKNIVNQSPSRIIAERVTLEAKRLLKFTTLHISEVAFRVGFEDVSYFIKYFKKHVGVSPGSYRNNIIS